MKQLSMLAVWLLVLPLTGMAAEKPEPAEVMKVVDYYFNGAGGGAVLTEAFLCREVSQEADDKNECAQRVEGPLDEGQEAYVWMNFLVPVNEEPNIIISFERKEKVRSVVEVKLKSAVRYRTWARIPTGKAGAWTVHILQEMENQDIAFADLTYEVTGAAQ